MFWACWATACGSHRLTLPALQFHWFSSAAHLLSPTLNSISFNAFSSFYSDLWCKVIQYCMEYESIRIYTTCWSKAASHTVYDDSRPLNSNSLVLGMNICALQGITCKSMQKLPFSAHNPLTRMLRFVLDSSAQLLLNDFMTLEGSRIDQLLDGICEPVLNAWNLKQQKDIRDQQVWLHVCSTAKMMSFTLANPQAE